MEDIAHKTGLTLGTLAQNNEVTGSAFRPWDNSSRTSEDLKSAHSMCFFPTCQVRVVRFYVSCLLLLSSHLLSSSSCSTATLDHSGLCRTSTTTILLSVPFRTSTTTIHAQCSLPDLNHDHHRQCSLPDLNRGYPRPVFPAGPQPRPSTPSVPCRTSTASIHAKCSLPDLNLGPSQLSVHRPSQLSVQRWTSTAR